MIPVILLIQGNIVALAKSRHAHVPQERTYFRCAFGFKTMLLEVYYRAFCNLCRNRLYFHRRHYLYGFYIHKRTVCIVACKIYGADSVKVRKCAAVRRKLNKGFVLACPFRCQCDVLGNRLSKAVSYSVLISAEETVFRTAEYHSAGACKVLRI